MPWPNPQRSEVAVDLPGYPGYLLRPTFAALVQIEGQLGKPILAIVRDIIIGDVGLLAPVAVIECCGASVAENPPLKPGVAGPAVLAIGMRQVCATLRDMLIATLAVDDPDIEDREPDPDEPPMGPDTLPWKRFLEAAGVMRWSTEQFWATTPGEFAVMLKGFAASRGSGKKTGRRGKPDWTRAQLIAEFEEMKRLYPDPEPSAP